MTRPLKDVLYKLIFEDGFSVKEVAKRFGVYEKTVYNWLRYYKL
ncbi:MAG: helix-turn-helix domain-containing protein, partial [Promethearchaeota archaeon]